MTPMTANWKSPLALFVAVLALYLAFIEDRRATGSRKRTRRRRSPLLAASPADASPSRTTSPSFSNSAEAFVRAPSGDCRRASDCPLRHPGGPGVPQPSSVDSAAMKLLVRGVLVVVVLAVVALGVALPQSQPPDPDGGGARSHQLAPAGHHARVRAGRSPGRHAEPAPAADRFAEGLPAPQMLTLGDLDVAVRLAELRKHARPHQLRHHRQACAGDRAIRRRAQLPQGDAADAFASAVEGTR